MGRRNRQRIAIALGVAVAAVLALQAEPGPKTASAATAPAEAQVNVAGFAFGDNAVGTPVRGLHQAHNHLWSSEGFGKGPFCGKTFDPGGVDKAMVDCPEHHPFGVPAWFEQLTSGQVPLTPHDTTGWPTFKDWPRADSMMHNQTYYKGLERLWRAGTRTYVDNMVSNRGLCILYKPQRESCDDMDNIRREIRKAREFEAFIDAQYGGPGKGWYRIVTDPAHARQVIADGKLAVTLGVETSEPFGCGRFMEVPRCDEAQIDRGLDELHRLGVRQMYLCHKYDNALCGVRMDSGLHGAVVNAGNFITTGQFWQVERCDGPRHDNTAAIDAPLIGSLLNSVVGVIKPVTLPVYPPGPHCNKLGLSHLGEHALKGMMSRGMIVELDHMSVKAADAALKVLADNDYPAAVSTHSWMDTGYDQRLQQLGGTVGGIALKPQEFIGKWRTAKASAPEDRPFGFGFGLDLNGLHNALPRPGEGPPVRYPFQSFDGHARLDRQIWGQKTWDYAEHGLAHEGLAADWLESVRQAAGAEGPELVDDLTNGSEAYLRMWEGARRR